MRYCRMTYTCTDDKYPELMFSVSDVEQNKDLNVFLTEERRF